MSGGLPGVAPAAFVNTLTQLAVAPVNKKSVVYFDVTLPRGVAANDLGFYAIVPVGTLLNAVPVASIREVPLQPSGEFGSWVRLGPFNLFNGDILAVGSFRGTLRFAGDQNDQV